MRTWRVMAALGAALVIGTADAEAQAFGAQLSWGDETDLGIGARLEYNVPNLLTSQGALANTFLIGSFDWFFPDCANGVDCTFWEINANLGVPITASTLRPYLGAGLNIAHTSIEDDSGVFDRSDTDAGLNLLGGLRFNIGNLSSFGEARVVLGGADQFVLTFGILLGGQR